MKEASQRQISNLIHAQLKLFANILKLLKYQQAAATLGSTFMFKGRRDIQ